ncbi:MAG: hypothetical protein PWQ79_1613 [Thermococcaceae archaeon]|nr:hypothetical protein [Thermococcaceae archaeon]MDK2914698.1 hypothetical protein [Thermococcaceae archaeon]
MPVVTIQVDVPESMDPEDVKRLLELEIIRLKLLSKMKVKKSSGNFKKLRGSLGNAKIEELKAYELEAEFGDLY